ncbi:MAG: alpha/beta hydrolase [Clostridia bacterium]|nr:alpha/beta hydrolase [Clostridia bacterium]
MIDKRKIKKRKGDGQTVTLSDVSFLQKGKGKDLVLFHGYLSCKETFAKQVEYFSRFYRVTALDFIGFGGSVPLTNPFSVSDYAAWTREVLTLLGVEKPHVIAHSFGCRVAVKAAASDPEIFDKILLTGAAGVILKRSLAYKIKVKTYRFVRRFAPKFAERRFGSTEYKTLSPVMKESYKKIVNEDLRADAQKLENPVLIVQGNADTTTPLKEAQAYLKCIKKGRLIEMNGGHFAFMDDPLTFNLIAEEFFYDGTCAQSSG